MPSTENEPTQTNTAIATLKTRMTTITTMLKDSKNPMPQFNLDNLTRDTFEYWDCLLRCRLGFYDLEFMLDPVPAAIEEEADFKTLNKLVRSNILVNITKEFVPFVKNDALACTMYATLRQMCLGSEEVVFIRAFSRVHELTESKPKNVEESIKAIRELIVLFKQAKNSDLIWIALFIQTLPPSMGHLKSALIGSEYKTIEEHFQRALKESHSSNAKDKPYIGAHIHKEPSKETREGFCFECGSADHWRSECPKVKSRRPNGRRRFRPRNRQPKNNCITNDVGSSASAQDEQSSERAITNHANNQTNQQPNDQNENRSSGAPLRVSNVNRRFINYAIVAAMNTNRGALYLDSGATDNFLISDHDCHNKKAFRSDVYVASGEPLTTKCMADRTVVSSLNFEITLKDCIVCPGLSAGFLSVPWFTRNGYTVTFETDHAKIFHNGQHVAKALLQENGLYELMLKRDTVNVMVKAKTNDELIDYWHVRLGHLNLNDLRTVLERKNIKVPTNAKLECVTCMKCKITRLPFPRKPIRSKSILDVVHTDLSGIIRVPNREHIKYFILFMDDFSRLTFIYLMKSKSEVHDIFESFKSMIELKVGKRIKTLKSDQGTEFKNKDFDETCRSSGMTQYFTAPRCAASNGEIERMNRTVEQIARVLLAESELGPAFFPYALMYAVYIKNRVPHSALGGRIPLEVFEERKVDFGDIKRFGCRVIYLADDENVGKFKERGRDAIFLGFPFESAGCYLYSIEKQTIIVRRHVQFVEERVNQLNDGAIDSETLNLLERPLTDYNDDNEVLVWPNFTVQQESPSPTDAQATEDNEVESTPTFSQEESPVELFNADDLPDFYQEDEEDADVVEEFDEVFLNQKFILNREEKCKFLADHPGTVLQAVRPVRRKGNTGAHEFRVINSIQLPRTHKQVRSSPERDLWLAAEEDEMRAMKDKRVFEEVPRPTNRQVLPLSWVYKVKYRPDGSIEKYKARLVVLGNLQRENDRQTYAPVLNELSLRTILSLAVNRKMHIHHADVCTAYLNAELEDEIYVEPPTGHHHDRRTVYRLRKCLYGLRESALAWYKKMKSILIRLGFRRSMSDTCVFYSNRGGNLTIVAVYVDDLLIIGDRLAGVERIKQDFNQTVTLTDKSTISQFLSLNINYDREKGLLVLNQTDYIKMTLEHFGMQDCHPKYTPSPSGAELFEAIGTPLENNGEFLSIVGRLIYLSTHSRPDITFITGRLCSFMRNPTDHHLNIAKHVLRYLRATQNYSLVYKRTASNDVITSCDADYANDRVSGRSVNGVCTQLYGNLISWTSRKQTNVSQSTCESEINAISEGINEQTYVTELIRELTGQRPNRTILNDNTAAIATYTNLGDLSKNKHYRVRINLIKDVVDDDGLRLKHRAGKHMIADMLTKPLTSKALRHLLAHMNLI